MNKIKKMRLKKKMSQEELAKAVGISQPYLSDLEKGNRSGTEETIKRIMEVLEKVECDEKGVGA